MSDGQTRDETGELQKVGDVEIFRVKGSYSFVTGGKTYRVDYTADENGYKAKSSVTDSQLQFNDLVGDRIDPNLLKTLAGG